MLLRTAQANVLWDCLPLLEEAIVELVRSMGRVSATEISVTRLRPA